MDDDFFRTVVASLGDGVLVVGSDERVLYANPAIDELFGGTPAGNAIEWIRERVHSAETEAEIHAEVLPPFRALRGEAGASIDVLVKSTGARIRVSARPAYEGGQSIFGALCMVRRVASDGRLDEDLDKARTFLDSIVENIPDMIFVKDAKDLRFERFNRAGEELLGIPRAMLLGKSDFDLFPPDQAVFFQQRDRETLRGGRLMDVTEEPIDTAKGRRWLHTKKIPILDEHGRPRYLLGISSDITARRSAEEALKQAHEELERRVTERTLELRRAEEELRHAQKLEAVGRLAGGVAHDFNNVLAVIMGHVGLMMQTPHADAEVQGGLAAIQEASEHAATLTRQLLAFSRKQVMQPRLLNLNRIVEQARSMLMRLLGEDVAVATTLAPDLWNIHADPALIEQVFVNLAVNARDAMPNGGELRITTANVVIPKEGAPGRGDLREGQYVELAVRDTGIGMDESTRARIFEPFFTTKAPGKGTGLGLSMAYGVVTQSGGNIGVESAPGQGTTFRVLLPRTEGPRSATPPPGPVVRLARGSETILVAEDEPALRGVVRSVLQQAGYVVLDAATGEDAVAVSSRYSGSIDLLLTDVVMPLMDGPTLARTLSTSRPTMRVLFMSGYTDERLAGHLGRSRVAPLAKPFSVETLTARVREALDSPKP